MASYAGIATSTITNAPANPVGTAGTVGAVIGLWADRFDPRKDYPLPRIFPVPPRPSLDGPPAKTLVWDPRYAPSWNPEWNAHFAARQARVKAFEARFQVVATHDVI